MLVDHEIFEYETYEDTVTHILTEKEYNYAYTLYNSKILGLQSELKGILPDKSELRTEIDFTVIPVQKDLKYGWKRLQKYEKESFTISWLPAPKRKWKMYDLMTKKSARKKLTKDNYKGAYKIRSDEFPTLFFLDHINLQDQSTVNPWLFDAVLFSDCEVSDEEIIHTAFDESDLADPFLLTFCSILDGSFLELNRSISDNLFHYQFEAIFR